MVTVAVLYAKNEEKALPRTLSIMKQFKAKGLIDQVLVINDHSTDSTAKIAEKFGAEVVYLGPEERGKTDGFRAGCMRAKQLNADIMLSHDSDVLHYPESTLLALKRAIQKGAWMSVATQWERKLLTDYVDLPKTPNRNEFNKIFDPQLTGFRAIGKNIIDLVASRNQKWEFVFNFRVPPIKLTNQLIISVIKRDRLKTKIDRERRNSDIWRLEPALELLTPKDKIAYLTNPVFCDRAYRRGDASGPQHLGIHSAQLAIRAWNARAQRKNLLHTGHTPKPGKPQRRPLRR